jgi:hypothetical protein
MGQFLHGSAPNDGGDSSHSQASIASLAAQYDLTEEDAIPDLAFGRKPAYLGVGFPT